MDGILFKLAENRYWYVQPDGALEPWLIAHSADFDVNISDPKSRVLQIQGPASFKIMSDASGGAIDKSMKYFHSGYYDLGGQKMYVSRTGWTGELGYEVYSDANTDYGKLWKHLMKIGASHGMVYASMASMEIRRIEAGILDNVTDFDTTMNPFEAGLGAFIDVDKEGYIGRKALQKVDKTVLLLGIKCDMGTPKYGGYVFEGTNKVAQVTAATWSPTLECGVAYVRFFEADDWIGKTVSVEIEEGQHSDCEVVSLPFYDVKKEIPRAINLT